MVCGGVASDFKREMKRIRCYCYASSPLHAIVSFHIRRLTCPLVGRLKQPKMGVSIMWIT